MPLDKSEGSVKDKLLPRCFEHRCLAREVEDQGSGNLTLITSRWNIVPPTIDSATTSTMILLCEHPAPRGMRERPISFNGLACADQGHPRAALDANDLWIPGLGAQHPVESYRQLARRRHLSHTLRLLMTAMQILFTKSGI